MPMQTYVVRVYRTQADHLHQLVGVVEQPGSSVSLPFSNVDELWAILTVPAPARPEPAYFK